MTDILAQVLYKKWLRVYTIAEHRWSSNLQQCSKRCVIEQHIEGLLKLVEPTNLGLGTPDAAALIARGVRGWANDMAVARMMGQDANVVLLIDLENAYRNAFRSTCLEAARSVCPQLASICAA